MKMFARDMKLERSCDRTTCRRREEIGPKCRQLVREAPELGPVEFRIADSSQTPSLSAGSPQDGRPS